MTDTTDIKALRSEAANIIGLLTAEGHQSFSLDKAADFFDDVFRLLESERQRADHNKVMQFAAEDVSASALRGWSSEGIKFHAANEEIKRLTAELAALKGEQVPFRYMAEWSSQYGGMEYDYSEVRSEMDEVAAEHDGSVIELFTAPQKPVVLLPKFTDRHTCINAGCDAASAYKEDVIAMNKAAGGIVKDGE